MINRIPSNSIEIGTMIHENFKDIIEFYSQERQKWLDLCFKKALPEHLYIAGIKKINLKTLQRYIKKHNIRVEAHRGEGKDYFMKGTTLIGTFSMDKGQVTYQVIK